MRGASNGPIERRGLVPGRLSIIGLALVAGAIALAAPDAPGNARELGKVRWQRDFASALGESAATGKPVFALFQEVPGCATCVGFGEGALSHPLLVEAAETAFVPIAVLNNRPGADAAVLERFGEPSWNNPVVRFFDGEGRDLIPRRDGIYTTHGLAARMVAALEAAGRPVPEYLGWVDGDARAPLARATFATHCFWVGEACLGSEPGVKATRASWQDGREVVEVWFDERQIDHATLVARARQRGCSDEPLAFDPREPPRPAKASDQKRHLIGTRYASLPLTRFQQTRVNAALAAGRDPTPWLSPRQREAVVLR